MPRVRENISLTPKDYDIAGNAIRAYYDNSGKLIFVLDETINADKPNVLLVIDSFDGRKWDDVLANDYNVNLETVRPKRDNKYQKLDIEYGGLDVYSELIESYESDEDLSAAIDNLIRFRAMAVRRAAQERLAAAEEIINKSHDTIERTNATISDLRSRIKELRAVLSEQRRGIGREPTKASAAKILKTEAQIDATNEKLSRAKKRLVNAQRRLTVAEEDAEIARAILARDVPNTHVQKASRVQRKQIAVSEPVALIEDFDDKGKDDDIVSQPRVEEMNNDDEVKPLFDKDPENLNDELAFKPIDFNAVDSTEDKEVIAKPKHDGLVNSDIAPAPLSFVPPTGRNANEDIINNDSVDTPSSPMLDSLTSVPSEDVDVSPDSEPLTTEAQSGDMAQEPEPFVPEEPIVPIVPVVSARPVSPITGTATPVEQKSQKSTFLYYVMLILLILLSIGTLWIYQKTTSDNVPSLTKTVSETSNTPSIVAKNTIDDVDKKEVENAFVPTSDIISTTVAHVVETAPVPEPVAVSVVEPEPIVEVESIVVTEPEPIVAELEPVVVEPEPVVTVKNDADTIVVESPFITPEPSATYEPEPVKIPSEEEVIASKPGYNVSQNEKMFVASSDYDTETIVEEEYDDIEVPMCEGGVAADSLGCCPGETYTYTDDGFMCCNTVECFPPIE